MRLASNARGLQNVRTRATAGGISAGGTGGGSAGPLPGGRPPLSSPACPSTTTSWAKAADASAPISAATLISAMALQVLFRFCCEASCARRRPVQMTVYSYAQMKCSQKICCKVRLLHIVREAMKVGSTWNGQLKLRTPRPSERVSLIERPTCVASSRITCLNGTGVTNCLVAARCSPCARHCTAHGQRTCAPRRARALVQTTTLA